MPQTDGNWEGHSHTPRRQPGRSHQQTGWGAPHKTGRRGSLQASRHSEKVVASRRRPPQIPQVTHGATTERRTRASAAAPARPPPRPSRAEVRRGGGAGGRRAVLPGRGRGRGPAVAAAEARRAPGIMADGGRWGAPDVACGYKGGLLTSICGFLSQTTKNKSSRVYIII